MRQNILNSGNGTTTMETKMCDVIKCPTWATWERWDECDKPCGGGKQSRIRKCKSKSGIETAGCVGRFRESNIN